MNQLNPQQKRKAERLRRILKNKDRAVFDDLNSLEDSILEAKDSISNIQLKKGDTGDQGEIGIRGEQGIQGEKGEKGDIGEQGVSGKDGRDGKNGYDGRNGVDGFNGKDGRDGIDGKDGRDGKDGSNAIETLDTLKQKLSPILGDIYNRLRGENYGGFIETGIKAGANITVSKDSSGAWLITSTASGGVGGWTAFTVNGITTTFSVSSVPTELNNDGIILFGQNGYTYSAGQVTFINPPQQFAAWR